MVRNQQTSILSYLDKSSIENPTENHSPQRGRLPSTPIRNSTSRRQIASSPLSTPGKAQAKRHTWVEDRVRDPSSSPERLRGVRLEATQSRLDDVRDDEEEDDDDEGSVSVGKMRKVKKVVVEDSEEDRMEDVQVIQGSSSEEDHSAPPSAPAQRRNAGKGKQRAVSQSDSEGDVIHISTPQAAPSATGRQTRGRSSLARGTLSEEDSDDLTPDPSPEKRTSTRKGKGKQSDPVRSSGGSRSGAPKSSSNGNRSVASQLITNRALRSRPKPGPSSKPHLSQNSLTESFASQSEQSEVEQDGEADYVPSDVPSASAESTSAPAAAPYSRPRRSGARTSPMIISDSDSDNDALTPSLSDELVTPKVSYGLRKKNAGLPTPNETAKGKATRSSTKVQKPSTAKVATSSKTTTRSSRAGPSNWRSKPELPSSPTNAKRPTRASARQLAVVEDSDEEMSASSVSPEPAPDSTFEPTPTPTKRSQTTRNSKSKTATRSRRDRITVVDDSSASPASGTPEQDSDAPPTPLKRMSSGKRKKAVVTSASESALDSDEAMESDGVQERRRRSLVKKGKKRARVRDPDEESSEEEMGAQELMDEIELDEPVILETKLRTRDKKSKFQLALDRKNRKKAGLPSESEGDQEEGVEEWVQDIDEDDYQIVEDDDMDDGFIEEDDEVFDGAQLPAEFRMAQDLEHHFKVICQYFFHLVVKGDGYARQKDSAYHRESFHIFHKKLGGIKDSMVTSSVWKPDFKKALEKYPEFDVGVLDEAVDGCDACRIGGRMSKYVGALRGKPYDRKTFSEFSDEEDEDSDDDTAFRKDDIKLGKYCSARAQVFHNFSHWELALYTAFSQPYARLLANREFRLRSGFNDRDVKEADRVVEWFDAEGKQLLQWQTMERMMESARQLDNMGQSRGGRDD